MTAFQRLATDADRIYSVLLGEADATAGAGESSLSVSPSRPLSAASSPAAVPTPGGDLSPDGGLLDMSSRVEVGLSDAVGQAQLSLVEEQV